MIVTAWDTETALFRAGRMAPELSCVTWQSAVPHDDRLGEPGIADSSQAYRLLRDWLEAPDRLVGHNVAFDVAVTGAAFPDLVPLWFKAYDADRVTDTMLRQKLLDIAAGQYRGYMGPDQKWIKRDYSLFAITKRHTGRALQKDGWRMMYGEFIGVPLDRWVEHAKTVQDKYRPTLADLEAKLKAWEDWQAERARARRAKRFPDPTLMASEFTEKAELADLREMISSDPGQCILYPLEDARATLDCYLAQEVHAGWLADQFRQARKALWLHLASCWGLRTDAEGVDRLREETETLRDEAKAVLVAAGLVREDGTRDLKAAANYMRLVCERDGRPVRMTDAGNVSLDADACEATGDSVLEAYAEYVTLGTILAKDVPALASGTVFPIHTHFDLADSGRTTSSGPNVQNWARAREGRQDIRKCFVPRRGFVFAQADYDQLELRTLAQVCISLFGHSRLAEVLNAGVDPHTALAADILGIPLETAERRRKDKTDKEFDAARQTAKVANFGLPGGLGPRKLVKFAKATYGVDLAPGGSEDEAIRRARELKAAWFGRWPEMEPFMAFIETLRDPATDLYVVSQLFVNRTRGGCTFNAACNTHFQGLGADAASRAGWLICRAQYADPSSPLFGSRTVNQIHDEWIVETPDGPGAHDAAVELATLMVKGANELLPDVPAKTEPCLMRVWSKSAQTIYGPDGRLVPWAPT